MEFLIPLRRKYNNPHHKITHPPGGPPDGTRVAQVGISSHRTKKGGNSGGVGRAARRRGMKSRRRAI